MFFEEGVWKTSKWGEAFIRHLYWGTYSLLGTFIRYLVILAETKIQRSAVAVK